MSSFSFGPEFIPTIFNLSERDKRLFSWVALWQNHFTWRHLRQKGFDFLIRKLIHYTELWPFVENWENFRIRDTYYKRQRNPHPTEMKIIENLSPIFDGINKSCSIPTNTTSHKPWLWWFPFHYPEIMKLTTYFPLHLLLNIASL